MPTYESTGRYLASVTHLAKLIMNHKLLWVAPFVIGLLSTPYPLFAQQSSLLPNQQASNTSGSDRQVFIGIRAEASASESARRLGIRAAAGAAVVLVTPGGPAAKAGLRAGDLIVEFANREVMTYDDLAAAVHQSPIGSRQRVIFVRGLQRLSTAIIIGSQPTSAPGPGVQNPAGDTWFTHAGGGYRFRIPQGWKVTTPELPGVPRERQYDRITSSEGAYRVTCFRSSWEAGQAEQALDQFVGEKLRDKPDSRASRFPLAGAPAARVAGYAGSPPSVVHRMSFVHQGRRYVINADAPGMTDVAQLPAPLNDLLKTLEFLPGGSSAVNAAGENFSPIEPEKENQNSPPVAPSPGWITKSTGNVNVSVPPDWDAAEIGMLDEGQWFKGPKSAPEASFSLVRDRTTEDLSAGITVDRKAEVLVSGRASEGIWGRLERGDKRYRMMIVVLKKPLQDGGTIAVTFYAPENTWNTYEATFQKILALVKINE